MQFYLNHFICEVLFIHKVSTMGTQNVCVLGAGIIGMTTAFMLKEKHPEWNVTIIADKFEEETLSDIAAGIFRPSTSFKGPTPEITKY